MSLFHRHKWKVLFRQEGEYKDVRYGGTGPIVKVGFICSCKERRVEDYFHLTPEAAEILYPIGEYVKNPPKSLST